MLPTIVRSERTAAGGTVSCSVSGAEIWYEYTAGTVSSFLAGCTAFGLSQDANNEGLVATEYFQFIVSSAAGLAAMVAVTFWTEPVDRAVLEGFFVRVQPPGLWRGVRDACADRVDVPRLVRQNFLDLCMVPVAVVWQISIFAVSLTLVLQNWAQLLVAAAVDAAMSVVLYRVW